MPLDINPYDPPREQDASHDVPDEPPPVRRLGPIPSFALFTGLAACGGFLEWCLIDFLYLRFLPQSGSSSIWLEVGALLLFSVVVIGGGLVWFRDRPIGTRLALALIALVLATPLCLALILGLGFPFHFAFGGRL